MLIVGLTGSIGMGKSTAAARLRHLGIDVFDADAEVHRLYDGPLLGEIENAFPGSVVDGKIDRSQLSALLVADPQKFEELEAIVHPRVRAGERAFLRAASAQDSPMAVLEIPLLFESGGDAHVDITILVSAAADIQRQRVLERPGMTQAKFEAILARQLPDAEKRVSADFVVDTGGSVENCNKQIDAIVTKIRAYTGDAYVRFWRD